LSTYVLGFIGSGKSSEANTKELLDDFVKPADELELVFPLVEGTEDWDISYVLSWSADYPESPLTVVTTKKIKDSGKFDELLEDDSVTVDVKESPYNATLDYLTAKNIHKDFESFLVVFQDEPGQFSDYTTEAISNDVTALDIGQGLDIISSDHVVTEEVPLEIEETLLEEELDPPFVPDEPKAKAVSKKDEGTPTLFAENASPSVFVPSNVPNYGVLRDINLRISAAFKDLATEYGKLMLQEEVAQEKAEEPKRRGRPRQAK
jgi:hypothetical protein